MLTVASNGRAGVADDHASRWKTTSSDSAAFDPYETWLGITVDQQPADYYRLLGISRFEGDRQVVNQAAARRLAYLKTLEQGDHGPNARRLISELSIATTCLLNARRKRLYDEHLRSGDVEERLLTLRRRARATRIKRDKPALPTIKAGPSRAKSPPHVSRVVVGGLAIAVLTIFLVAGMGLQSAPADPEPAKQTTVPAKATTVPVSTLAASRPTSPATTTPVPESVSFDEFKQPEQETTAEANESLAPEADATETPDDASTAEFIATSDKPLGDALSFDGDDHIRVHDSQELVDFNAPFTIELWTRVDPAAKSHWLIGDLVFGATHADVPPAVTAGWQVWMERDDEHRWRVAFSTGKGFWATLPSFDDRWRHIAVSSDAEQVRLFVDGRLAGMRPASLLRDHFYPSPLGLHVGSHPHLHTSQPDELRGHLRGVRVSSVARYSENFTPAPDWKADEAAQLLLDFSGLSATQIADSSIFGRHGEINGASWQFAAVGATSPATVVPPVAEMPEEVESEPARQPVPDAAALASAREELHAIFGEEAKAAKKPDALLALSDKLADLARRTSTERASQYVLFHESCRLLVRAHELGAAHRLIDEWATAFDIDATAMKIAAAKKTLATAKATADRQRVVRAVIALTDDLKWDGHFDDATELLRLAVPSAARSRDVGLAKAARHQRGTIEAALTDQTAANEAREQLELTPDDPSLNETYGSFLCLRQGRWDLGVRYLAKGSDALLRRAADLELTDVADANSLDEIAEAWQTAADNASTVDRVPLLVRALYWSHQASPGLAGLLKAKADKRIAEIELEVPWFARRGVAGESLADGSTVAPTETPPRESWGMLGRVQVDGRDAGVLWKYESGLQLTDANVATVLAQAGTRGKIVRIEFAGLLYLDKPTTVNITHRGGSRMDGTTSLQVGKRRLGEVGGDRATSDVYKLDLKPGQHAVRWVLGGTTLGNCSLQFTVAETGQALPVYHTEPLLTAVRETPTRARLNVNMVRN